MKCETCIYYKMCRLRNPYMNAISMVAEITDTQEPNYSNACNAVGRLFDDCVSYEAKP